MQLHFLKHLGKLIHLNSTEPNVYNLEQIQEYVFHLQLTWHIDITIGDHLPREIAGKVSAVCLMKKLALVCQAAFYFASLFRIFWWSLQSDPVRFAKLLLKDIPNKHSPQGMRNACILLSSNCKKHSEAKQNNSISRVPGTFQYH